MHSLRLVTLLALLCTGLLTGCQTTKEWEGIQSSRMAAVSAENIRAEEPGDYYIGRRYYKNDYKFWGYVRRPGEPWSSAKLVMLNEGSKLAPDRELGRLGSDNGYEYKLIGDFSGDTVYEPASNGFYPEFVLKNYELRSAAPGSIFRTAGALDPSRRIIARPQ
ncbi:MAG: hypothetical protein ACO1QR_00575 [Chthoniobacteraceae bacterium]